MKNKTAAVIIILAVTIPLVCYLIGFSRSSMEPWCAISPSNQVMCLWLRITSNYFAGAAVFLATIAILCVVYDRGRAKKGSQP